MANKKPRGSVHTTISLSLDLRRRMTACKKQVNWSALAAQAFEAELARINTRREKPKMRDVIERLRATERELESERFAAGREAGRQWAMRKATGPELRRLNQECIRIFDLSCEYTLENWLEPQAGFIETSGDRFIAAIRPEAPLNGNNRSFFKDEFKTENDLQLGSEQEFVHGFAAGAIELWEQVQGEL